MKILLTAALLLLTACASSSFRNEWKAPDDNGPALRRVLVVGVTRRDDVRQPFEDGFVEALKARSVEAVASHTTALRADPDSTDALREAVQATGADGVLVTRLLRIEPRDQIVNSSLPPGPPPGIGMYRVYPGFWTGYYEPPRVIRRDVAILETRVYRTDGDRLAWSGTSEAFTPLSDVRGQTRDLSRAVITSLEKARLIAP
ncbi:MAG: hypothetical protein WCJ69_01350 [Betaproteobacteria bacterium]|jgi:hypothetical protein